MATGNQKRSGEDVRVDVEDEYKYQWRVKSEGNSGQQIFGNHGKFENNNTTIHFNLILQQNNRYYVLDGLSSENSSDSGAKPSRNKSKKHRRKISKKKKRNNRVVNNVSDGNACKDQKQGLKESFKAGVFDESQSTTSSEFADKAKHNESESYQTFQQGNVSKLHNEASFDQIDTVIVRERKVAANTCHEVNINEQNPVLESSGKVRCQRKEVKIAPMTIAIKQLFCYCLCFAIGCYLEWPYWILPYSCYLIFAIINILACISCIKFTYKSKTESEDEQDIEAEAWMGIGIKDQKSLAKLVGLFLVVSLAFLSSQIFGCTSCTWMQTVLLFIASTYPYLTFEKDMMILKVLQDQRQVYRELNVAKEKSNKANV